MDRFYSDALFAPNLAMNASKESRRIALAAGGSVTEPMGLEEGQIAAAALDFTEPPPKPAGADHRDDVR